MSKYFHKRSILKPEKTKIEEEFEKEEEKKLDTKNKKCPTSAFDGINKDRDTIAMEKSIRYDHLQGNSREDDWIEER